VGALAKFRISIAAVFAVSPPFVRAYDKYGIGETEGGYGSVDGFVAVTFALVMLYFLWRDLAGKERFNLGGAWLIASLVAFVVYLARAAFR
jgi:hypothetical protein